MATSTKAVRRRDDDVARLQPRQRGEHRQIVGPARRLAGQRHAGEDGLIRHHGLIAGRQPATAAEGIRPQSPVGTPSRRRSVPREGRRDGPAQGNQGASSIIGAGLRGVRDGTDRSCRGLDNGANFHCCAPPVHA